MTICSKSVRRGAAWRPPRKRSISSWNVGEFQRIHTTYYDVHGAELLLQVFGAEFHVAPAATAHQATSSYALMTRMYRIPMHR